MSGRIQVNGGSEHGSLSGRIYVWKVLCLDGSMSGHGSMFGHGSVWTLIQLLEIFTNSDLHFF